MTAGKTSRSVFRARTWCSNWPVHSTYMPGGKLDLLLHDPPGLLDEADLVAVADAEPGRRRGAGRSRS